MPSALQPQVTKTLPLSSNLSILNGLREINGMSGNIEEEDDDEEDESSALSLNSGSLCIFVCSAMTAMPSLQTAATQGGEDWTYLLGTFLLVLAFGGDCDGLESAVLMRMK